MEKPWSMGLEWVRFANCYLAMKFEGWGWIWNWGLYSYQSGYEENGMKILQWASCNMELFFLQKRILCYYWVHNLGRIVVLNLNDNSRLFRVVVNSMQIRNMIDKKKKTKTLFWSHNFDPCFILVHLLSFILVS